MDQTVRVILNGAEREVPPEWTIGDLVEQIVSPTEPVAVELNREIIRRDLWLSRQLKAGDEIEVVGFVGGGEASADPEKLVIGELRLSSRLILGTGKYTTHEIMRDALLESGTEMVTVAVRRVDVKNPQDSFLAHIDRKKYHILPNTAGCYTAEDAVRYARLGREAGLSSLIKLEVLGDEKTLFPDNEALLEATRTLVKEGFTVLPYTNDDPVMCKKLQDLGAAAVMPLGAPIGSGLGIQNPNNIAIIREFVSVPLIVDAGVGTASDAAVAMELGADGVLMNTGIAGATDPVSMARAMRLAVRAGRLAFQAGRIPKRRYATASSPLEGMLTS